MRDLTDPRWIQAKGALLLALGIAATGLLLAEHRDWRTVTLLAVAIWAFCRAYYFAFYVIQHYVDPAFRLSGLMAFARYLWSKRRDDRGQS